MYYTTNDILKLFRMKNTQKSSILNAEKNQEIPTAEKIARGSIKVRQWKAEDLPIIGNKFGFLKKSPGGQKVISVYTPKGGVTKTTLSANMGRMLALNGIKTILVGLDFQQSLTRYISQKKDVEIDLEKMQENQNIGLHHILFENCDINESILKTDLPTLDIIPETSDLNFMSKKIRLQNRREYLFVDRLIKKLSDYDVIIFDCNPGWNDLTENTLVASNTIIMPLACEIECYEALQANISEIIEYRDEMRLEWDKFVMIPSLLENTAMSQAIYKQYINMYQESIIPFPTRRSVIAQEARVNNVSVIEHSPKSVLANDYFDMITSLWEEISNV